MRRLPLKLAEMTFEEVETLSAEQPIALLPAGATEAHGPHLPLMTDVVISETAALRSVARLRGEGVAAAVLPPLAYAVTDFASEFKGTITLPFETAAALARDVMIGAGAAGFAGVVVCNAHLEPGNLKALAKGAKQATEAGVPSVLVDVTRKPHALRLGEEFKSGACHAGSYETSLVLAADPFLVLDEVAEGLEENPSSLSVAIREGKSRFIEAGGPRAYFGAPAKASAGEGEQLYAELVDIFVTAAKELSGSR